MLDALLTGLGAGIILPFLPGPVLFAIIRTGIEKGFAAGMSIAIGVFFADLFFITLMLFGSELIPIASGYDEYNQIIGYIGGALMLGIGLFYFFKKTTLTISNDHHGTNIIGYLIKGLFMSLFSPPTILYWITVTSIVTLQFKYSLNEKLLFFTCLLSTQIAIDGLKAFLASFLRNKITAKTIGVINKVAGVMLVLFAARLLIEAILGKKLF